MRRALSVVLFALACAPEQRLTWSEEWELLGLTRDGGLLDVTVSVGNTGTLRGEGRLRLDRAEPGSGRIGYTHAAGPEETTVFAERQRVEVGTDRLEAETGRWALRIRSSDANAVVLLRPWAGVPRPEDAEAEAFGGALRRSVPVAGGDLDGWIEAGKRGGQVQGAGLLVHRAGSGVSPWPRRRLAVLGGAGLIVFAEQHGALDGGFLVVDGESAALGPTTWSTSPSALELQSGTLAVTLRRPRHALPADPTLPELTALEALLLRGLGGPPARRAVAFQAEVALGSQRFTAPALLIEEGHPDLLLPLPRERRP